MVVDGSIVSSSGLTATAGMLMGTGTVPVTRIATGATLRPGSAADMTGTLTVAGNLTLDAGSVYSVQIMATNAAKTAVTGSTSIAGGFQAVGLGGNYVFNTPYTVLTSTNGRAGEFGSNTSSNLSAVTVNLTYDPNNVFVTLGPNLAGAIQGTPSTSNENRVAVAIDSFVTRGGRLPAKFQNLYAESGDELTDELDEVAGVNDSGGVHAAFKLTNAFLQLMLNPFAASPGGNPADSGASRAFAAADRALSPKAAAAYAAVTPNDTRHAASRWGIWAQPYGGWNKTKGDFDLGLPDTAARAYGLATGFDYRLDPDPLVGFALAGAGTSWSVYGIPQGGRSDAFQLGVYGSRSFGPAYVAAAVSYAWNKVTTDRTIEATGDQLRAEFDAHALGARLETGYRVPAAYVNIIPYAALQAQTYRLPAYSEFAVAGDDTFALSYAARSVNALRTELGAWLERSAPLDGGSRMTLRTRAAWAHDRSSDASVELAFKTLPGVGFVDAPAKQAPDALLLTAGAELRLPGGLSIGGKIDGEFASGSRTYAGSAVVRYEW
jgi:outer membrane autotransporter protein